MSTTPFPDEMTQGRGPVDRYGRPLPPPPEYVGGTSPPPIDPGPDPEPEPEPPEWTGAADPLPAPRFPIDRETAWRSEMDCGVETWQSEAWRLGSPISTAEIANIYGIVQPWAAQCLATGVKETELGATATGSHNFLNLFDSGGATPKNYATWFACATEWWERMTNEDYKGGVYMPRDLSIEQQVSTFQGGPGCWESQGDTCANGETWQPCGGGSATSNTIELSIQQFVARCNTFMGHQQEVPWTPVAGGAGCTEAPSGSSPVIHKLPQDAARYGISQSCASYIVGNNFPNRSGRPIQRIVLHTQEGTTPGSLGWWCSQGIQASSTIMAQKDGSLLYIVPEKHGPWTNGDTCSPTGDGVQAVNECAQNPNCCSLTVETEGYFGDNHPKAQIDAIAWQCRKWMDQYGLTCADILGHRDYNQCSRANCSGQDIYNKVMSALGCKERW